MLKGFHHVAIICSDYPRSKTFYTDIGFSIIDENYREARDSTNVTSRYLMAVRLSFFSFRGTAKTVTSRSTRA